MATVSNDLIAAHKKAKVVLPIGEKSIITISQRSSKGILEYKDKVTLSIGDITAGQVMTSVYFSIKDANGIYTQETLMHRNSMRSGDKRTIKFKGKNYQIKLNALHNALLGNDKAVFTIQEVAIKPVTKKANEA